MGERATRAITIADNVDSVTTVGPEDAPDSAGLTRDDVERIWNSVREWYRMGTTPAIQLCLRRNGHVLLNRAIGHGWGDGPRDRPGTPKIPVTPDTPFCGFSTAKGVTAAVVFMLLEQGMFRLEDPVSHHIPEFGAHGKDRITIGDVMSHSAGVPFVPGRYRAFDLVVDEDLAARALADLEPSWRPGRLRVYHALTLGLIVRLLVRRATGRSLREHLAEQILTPLSFRWTNFGVGPDDVDKVVPSVPTGPPPPRLWTYLARRALGGGGMTGAVSEAANRAFLTAELPSGNLVTTAWELSRFYEILRRGGELDGVQIMQPDTVRAAVRPAEWIPSLAGRVSRAGFELGGRRSKMGRNTQFHFGRSGLTTQYGWADPVRGLSGAFLTNGKATADAHRPSQLLTTVAATIGRTDGGPMF